MIAERRSRRIREMTTLRITTLVVICLTILLVAWNALNVANAIIAGKQLATIKAQLDQQRASLQIWNDTQQQIKAKLPVVALLRQVQNSECAWMTVYADLSNITPPGVVLTSQSCSEAEKSMKLELSGRVSDEQTFANFMLAFSQRTSWAGQPLIKTFSSVSEDKVSKLPYSFNLEVPIQGLVGGGL
jgi:Tfp pilus assembly protein PilN